MKTRCPTSKLTTAVSSATGNTNAAVTPALAASTRRLVGVAVKVDRIIPVDVLGSDGPHAECREQHGADEDDAEQRTGGRVERAGAAAAVMLDHCWTWETQRIVPRAIEMTMAMTTVRQVEGRVRSLVHSALRVRRIFGVRSRRSRGCEVNRIDGVGRSAHVRLLWLRRPAGRRGSRFRPWSGRNTPLRATTPVGPARRG